MTIARGLEELGIVRDFLPVGFPTRSGRLLQAEAITIHNTDNTSVGADAEAHNRYIRGDDAVKRSVSWHFTVDDRVIYQHLPINEVGYHAGSAANAASVAIEICMHSGIDMAAARRNAARLCAALGAEFGLKLPAALRQHHDWTGKNCPSDIRKDPTGWLDFQKLVAKESRAQRRAETKRIAGMAVAAPDESVLANIATSFANHFDSGHLVPRALPIPLDDPVPFATSSAVTRYWPVVTRHSRATEVNTLLASGGASGANVSRRFLANRANGTRYHVGIDLYCSEGDGVVAIESGKIVSFYPFYAGTWALLVDHGAYVANYGEVAGNSLSALGLAVNAQVQAGQRIGTVGLLKMLHFETYTGGTKKNYRWMQNAARPNRLLNPSQLLLDTAASGLRLDPDGAVVAPSNAPAARHLAAAAKSFSFVPADLPAMDDKGWHKIGGGQREWRYDARGLFTRVSGVETAQRWESDLDTMRRIMERMGEGLLAAANKHGIPPALLMMTVATESHVNKAASFTGPRSFRWEAHVTNRDIDPPAKGDYSAGPMQVLGTTARWLARNFGKDFDLDFEPFALAPYYTERPSPPPAQNPLYDPATSLDLGAAHIRFNQRTHDTGMDPILVAAAYNAGSLRIDANSPWGLRASGDHLDRAGKWYGDACAYLIETGIT